MRRTKITPRYSKDTNRLLLGNVTGINPYAALGVGTQSIPLSCT